MRMMKDSMKVLIDTCVWLDLAADARQRTMLDTMEAFIALGHIELLIPRLVVDEFKKNRERVAKAGVKGIASQVQQVKEAIRSLELNARRRKMLLAGLDDVKHKAPLVGGGVEQALRHIDGIFRAARIIETSDAVKVAAAERALTRQAPCHRDNKNSIADAMLIEIYAAHVTNGNSGERFAFVTHNKHDFSSEDFRKPHADIAGHFTKIKSRYCINLSELLARIDPSAFSEIHWELSWQQEPRSMSELQQAEYMYSKAVWYNRHMNLRYQVERGEVKVVTRAEWERLGKDNNKYIIDEIFEGAKRSAEKTAADLGDEVTGPWTDFEWGMINGKLSTLRWMLGEEWDELYT